ncbi:MAG: hypothetical protein OXE55_02500 [Flavobacteriaceae bacterium]|nr:hypothetical protein [Flavobacteriaceae bacterium]
MTQTSGKLSCSPPPEKFRRCSYRPLTKVHTYFDDIAKSAALYTMPPYFPHKGFQNKVIAITPENNSYFGIWVADFIPSIHILSGGNNLPQRFKLVHPDDSPIFNETHHQNTVEDGISDWILEKAKETYTSKVTKEDLFHYVYGFLHSPIYRKKYANTLTKQAPSIPLVDENSFWPYVNIGKKLMDLHLDYENQPKLPEVEVSGEEHENFMIRKMQFAKDDKTRIVFNDDITISGIPLKAYDYLITDKSAIWWVMNQYEATIGNGKKYRNRKQSANRKDEKDIPNDPNIYAQEIGNPRYILDLLLSVITLSVKTLDIVEELREININ